MHPLLRGRYCRPSIFGRQHWFRRCPLFHYSLVIHRELGKGFTFWVIDPSQDIVYPNTLVSETRLHFLKRYQPIHQFTQGEEKGELTTYPPLSLRRTLSLSHYQASHPGIVSIISDIKGGRRTSVKSILRRKAAVADFLRIVWLFGFFQAEHNCRQPPFITSYIPLTWLYNVLYPFISFHSREVWGAYSRTGIV